MFSLTRILNLAAAGAFIALSAASSPARAGSAQNLGAVGPHEPILATVGQADLNPWQMGECRLQRRAISRRACQASLWRGAHIDTAENK
jgi:hypothetical protein